MWVIQSSIICIFALNRFGCASQPTSSSGHFNEPNIAGVAALFGLLLHRRLRNRIGAIDESQSRSLGVGQCCICGSRGRARTHSASWG